MKMSTFRHVTTVYSALNLLICLCIQGKSPVTGYYRDISISASINISITNVHTKYQTNCGYKHNETTHVDVSFASTYIFRSNGYLNCS